MIKIAVVDDTINAQLETNIEEAQNLDLVYNKNNLEFFLSKVVSLNPKVVVVDLKYLENYPDPVAKMEEVIRLSKSELCIILYQFAKKELIDKLETKFSKVIKKPISLKSLKVHMLGVILKDISEARKKDEEALLYTKSNYKISESSPSYQNSLSEHKSDIKYIITKLNSLESNIYLSKKSDKTKSIYGDLIEDTIKAKNIMVSALEKI
ncbi:MAG: hypothetical protein H7263_08710 [Candidatus Sericytochromatia bacterium]|nr:hypothetical protein [Candidatus Sericytochromatia bacterium]